MTREERIEALAALLRETGEAHHQAFLETDGDDPEWAIWYARQLREPLKEHGIDLDLLTLVDTLIGLNEERNVCTPDEPWPRCYARHLVERFVPRAEETLALYYFPSCPYCRRVTRVIERLGLDVELRHIFEEPQHRRDLIAARGRATVPVLRCTSDGEDRWMPESRDIVAYLERRFGHAA